MRMPWEQSYGVYGRSEPKPFNPADRVLTVMNNTVNLGTIFLKEGEPAAHNGMIKRAPRSGYYDTWLNHRGNFCIALNNRLREHRTPVLS